MGIRFTFIFFVFSALMVGRSVLAEAPYYEHREEPAPAVKPSAPPVPFQSKNDKQDKEYSRKNYCHDGIMRTVTSLLYAVNGSPFVTHKKYEGIADPKAKQAAIDNDRSRFLQQQINDFLIANSLPAGTVTSYRHRRPRYFEMKQKVPGFSKKFETVRYTLDSPRGSNVGTTEEVMKDVIKVEPIDPQTHLPFEPAPVKELCRYNAYHCLSAGGCQSSGMTGFSSRAIQTLKGRALLMLDRKSDEI